MRILEQMKDFAIASGAEAVIDPARRCVVVFILNKTETFYMAHDVHTPCELIDLLVFNRPEKIGGIDG